MGDGVEWMGKQGNARNAARRSAGRDRIRNFVRAARVETPRGRMSIRAASARAELQFRRARVGRIKVSSRKAILAVGFKIGGKAGR